MAALKVSIVAAACLLQIPQAFGMGMLCVPYDQLESRLTGKYGETRFAGGVSARASYLEVWWNSETSTYTVLRVIRKVGQEFGCIVDTGDGWTIEKTANLSDRGA